MDGAETEVVASPAMSAGLSVDLTVALLHYLARSLRTSVLTAGLMVALPVGLVFRRPWGPRLLRWYFQSCGGGFTKFGQILAMRYDTLPPRYCEELSKLFDRVPPAPFLDIVRTIEGDLRRPVEDCFETLDPQPIGSASIAQAHAATLWDGQQVAVKVMRPGISAKIQADLFNLTLLGKVLDLTRFFSPTEIDELVQEVSRVVRQELDFSREAQHTQYIHDRMATDSLRHRAPRVYFPLCGPRVLTLERLEGVWMHDLVQAVQDDDRELLEQWKERGIRPQRAAKLLMRSFLHQAFHHRVFHADPHAGNLLVMDGGTLGFVDFGIVSAIDEKMCETQVQVYRGLGERKVHAAYEAILDTIEPVPEGKVLGLLEDSVKELLWRWVVAAESDGATAAEKSSGNLVFKVANRARQLGLKLPWRFLVMHRTALLADSLVYALNPRHNPRLVVRAYFRHQRWAERRRALCPERLLESAASAVEVALQAPVVAHKVLRWIDLQLPRLARIYAHQLSKIEQMFLLVLRYSRRLLWVLALFLVAAQLFDAPSWLKPFVPTLPDAVTERWWSAGFCALLAFLLGRLEERIKRLD